MNSQKVFPRGEGENPHEIKNVHLNIRIDKKELSVPAGISVAAALMMSGQIAFRISAERQPRGLFCGMGVCYECLVEIDGVRDQRACMAIVQEGMQIRTKKENR